MVLDFHICIIYYIVPPRKHDDHDCEANKKECDLLQKPNCEEEMAKFYQNSYPIKVVIFKFGQVCFFFDPHFTPTNMCYTTILFLLLNTLSVFK